MDSVQQTYHQGKRSLFTKPQAGRSFWLLDGGEGGREREEKYPIALLLLDLPMPKLSLLSCFESHLSLPRRNRENGHAKISRESTFQRVVRKTNETENGEGREKKNREALQSISILGYKSPMFESNFSFFFFPYRSSHSVRSYWLLMQACLNGSRTIESDHDLCAVLSPGQLTPGDEWPGL